MLNVSETVRNNMYDQDIDQRLLLVADDGYGNKVVIENEDITVNGGANFQLESINTQPLMFGCTPASNMSVTLVNGIYEGARRYRTSDLGERQFKAYFGIQTASASTRIVPKLTRGYAQVLCACRYEDIEVMVLDTGEIVGNVTFGSFSAFTYDHVYEAKMAIVFGTIYVRYDIGDGYVEYKLRKTGARSYGDLEAADINAVVYMRRIWETKYLSVSLGAKRMEYTYEMIEEDPGFTVWGTFLNGTWADVNQTWAKYTGYYTLKMEVYYSIAYGAWNTDIPRRTDSDIITLTAHDNMSKFEVDSHGFIDWMRVKKPSGTVTCKELIEYMCEYLGIEISSISNFSRLGGGGSRSYANVIDPRAYANMKSCKDLLSYALEVGATNGLFDRNGKFKTYHSTVSGDVSTVLPLQYVYTTDIADYATPKINVVQTYLSGDIVKFSVKSGVYPYKVVYTWSDNPYFNDDNEDKGYQWWFGSDNQDLLGNYHDAVITSCADYSLWVDDVYSVESEGETFREPIFSMNVTWNAHGMVTYSNTGYRTREQQTYEQREAGINNSPTKVVSGDYYRVVVGDNGDTLDTKGLQFQMTPGVVAVGTNSMNMDDPTTKCMHIDNYSMVMVNQFNRILGTNQELTFTNRDGLYKMENMQTSTSAANLRVDPESGMLYRITSLRSSKDNVVTIDNAWAKVDNLRGVSYTSNCENDDPNTRMYGFIAEEVLDAVPELAEFDHRTLSSVQYDRFTALLIEDCKESHRRIRELEDRIKNLEGRLK